MFIYPYLAKASLGLGLVFALIPPAFAQITPNGAGTVVNPQGNQINITGGTQAGANLFHSFRDFNVNSNQVANFLSNPQTQNILGRINGGNPSFINGLLQVTGGNSNLFLMNPAGIVFGQGASLNVPASFTATTANQIGFGNNLFNAFGDNNFSALTGNPDSFIFTTNQAGSIVNAGNLSVAPGQGINLIGGNIVNTGNINAGNITLAAVPGTNRVRISQPGHLLSLEIIPPVDSVVTPLDLPRLLTGSNLPGIVSNGETVQVAGVNIPSGQGINITSGNLSTGSQGGIINVLGDRVAIVNANLNASGSNGGGTIRVGGEYRGGGVNPFNSRITYVDSNSFLNADAVNSGNGGRVIVWADDTTRFYGNISGRGITGSGGFVEVSGKVNLAFDGRVELPGANGLNGTLLLDPTDIIIQAGVGSDDGSLPNIGIGATPATMTISAGALAAILPTTTVDIQASNNIIFTTPVTFAECITGICGGIAFTAGGIFNTNGNDITATGRNFSIRAGSIDVRNVSTGVITPLRNGGNINLTATTGNIRAGNLDSSSGLATGNSGDGGNITIEAPNGFVTITSISSLSAVSGDTGTNRAGNAGNLSINAQGLSVGDILAYSRASRGTSGDGGDIIINVSGSLLAGNIVIGSIGPVDDPNDPNPPALAPTISDILNGASGRGFGGTGNGGNLTINREVTSTGGITISGAIVATGSPLSREGENIELNSSRYIDLQRIFARNIVLNAGLDINIGTIGAANFLSDSEITLIANGDINIGSIDSMGANVTITGRNLDLGDIFTGSSADYSECSCSNVNLVGEGSVEVGRIDTGLIDFGNNFIIGSVNINAGNSIRTGDIDTTGTGEGFNGTDVNVNLTAGDDILTGNIETTTFYRWSRGNVNLDAGNNIQTGFIATERGSVNLSSGRDISTTSITTNYGLSGINLNNRPSNDNLGTIDVSATNLFRATGSTDSNGNIFSLSSGGGAITITHGGSTSVPFLVGGATNNGTTAEIRNTSGSGTHAINGLTVPVPPEVNTYRNFGTNITIRTTVPTPPPIELPVRPPEFPVRPPEPIDISIFPLLTNPEPPPTPNPVIVGTPPILVVDPIPTTPIINIPVNPPSTEQITIVPPIINNPTMVVPSPSSTNPQLSRPILDATSPGTQSPISLTAANSNIPIIDRIPTNSLNNRIRLLDDPFKEEFQAFTGLVDEIATLDVNQAQDILNRITKETNVKPAFMYVFFSPANDANAENRTTNSARSQLFRNPSNTDTLEIVLVPPTGDLVRVRYPGLTRPEVIQIAGELTRSVARNSVYGNASRRMYDLIITPLEEDLKRLKIDNLVFLLDAGLRSMPIAAMQSKDNKFIIEDYSVGLMPSLTLTDTTYSSLKDSQVMAMGADRFVVDNLAPLPGVPVELKAVNQIRGGNIFLNENFTLSNLRQNRRPEQRIVHLATHGSFLGDKTTSFIQLWGTERLTLDQIRSSGFGTPPVDLLVLSACETALGNRDAELGFAGLAVTSGVRSALASLWQVSDEGTMGLMAEFYQQLQTTTTKSEALRQAQLAMLRGEVRLEGGSLVTPKGNFALNDELKRLGDKKLTHPFFWSAFTMIGNPW